MDLSNLSLGAVIALFAGAAAVVAVAGTLMTHTADRLADATGVGEAVFGAVFLGGSTSLPGIVASVTAAAEGHAELAVSNAIGGIAAQTTFLAVADMTWRKANLEHAAASPANLIQGALCSTLLAIPMLGLAGPDLQVLGVHPASIFLVAAYVFGLSLVSRARTTPMWRAEATPETQADEPDEPRAHGRSLWGMWARFALLAGVTALAGYVIAQAGLALSDKTGLSEGAVGAVFTAVSTSLPELVTSVAAVRRGALTLAVGDIIGGNSFDVLFIAFSDAAYREGSIYAAVGERQIVSLALAILLTNVLLLGLLRREKHGIGGIGFESVAVLVLYGVALAYFFT